MVGVVIISLISTTIHAQENVSNIEILRDSLKLSSMRNIYMKSRNNGKAYYNDREIATKEDVGRCTTFVIAASNASEKSKIGADYVCTGVNDNEKIQEVVDYIANLGVGGKIQLTEGDYNFSNGVWFSARKDNKALSISIEGLGNCTTVHRRYSFTDGKCQGLFSFELPVNPNITNKYVTTIRNMKYNGHMDEYSRPEIQSFATSYTERTDILETAIIENIICENIYNQSNVFIGMGCNLIATSLDLRGAHPGYGISAVPSYNQNNDNNIFVTIEKCNAPVIELRNAAKSFVINNIAQVIHLYGKNIICSGNIYTSIGNQSENSIVSNNLQITP